MSNAERVNKITPETLHENGFQSYVNKDGPWWVLEPATLYFNYHIQTWIAIGPGPATNPGNQYNEHLLFTWEDFLAYFSKHFGREFTPGPVVERTYIIK